MIWEETTFLSWYFSNLSAIWWTDGINWTIQGSPNMLGSSLGYLSVIWIPKYPIHMAKKLSYAKGKSTQTMGKLRKRAYLGSICGRSKLVRWGTMNQETTSLWLAYPGKPSPFLFVASDCIPIITGGPCATSRTSRASVVRCSLQWSAEASKDGIVMET